jgi:hypothetical protein
MALQPFKIYQRPLDFQKNPESVVKTYGKIDEQDCNGKKEEWRHKYIKKIQCAYNTHVLPAGLNIVFNVLTLRKDSAYQKYNAYE